MKRFLIALSILCLAVPGYAAPRAQGFFVTATNVAASKTPAFNPASGCIINTDVAVDVYVNVTGATASTSSDGTTWKIPAGKSMCWGSNDQNVMNVSSISYVTASSTAAIIINLFRGV